MTTQNGITAIAEYRLPKQSHQEFSVTLTLFQSGRMFFMTGGRNGTHTIATDDKRRVRAHWAGYVSNNRGRTVRPSTIRFTN